jgi:hypothetical protein
MGTDSERLSGLTKGAFFRHLAIKKARAIAEAEHPAP